jgi:hypothetical protein
MLNKDTLQEVDEETKRFSKKLEKFKKAMADSSHWKEYKTPPWPCAEAAELKRASLDLSKVLARMRRVHQWNEEKNRWE